MKAAAKALILTAGILFSAGCSTITSIPTGTPALTLAQKEERTGNWGLKFTFPAGDYLPDFASEKGIFYIAPTSVIFTSLGVNTPFRGGIFVPHRGAKDQRQAAWSYGRGDAVGGLFTAGDTGVHSYRYDLPIRFLEKPNKGPEPAPTPTSVAPRAAQESRQP
jgi:hypothetical protein